MGERFRNKIKDFGQHKNEDEEKRGIVKEMVNDANKYFDNNNDYCTNQQLIGYRDLFREFIVK